MALKRWPNRRFRSRRQFFYKISLWASESRSIIVIRSNDYLVRQWRTYSKYIRSLICESASLNPRRCYLYRGEAFRLRWRRSLMMDVKLVRWHSSTFLLTKIRHHRITAGQRYLTSLVPRLRFVSARADAYRLAKNRGSSHKRETLDTFLSFCSKISSNAYPRDSDTFTASTFSANMYFSSPECEYRSKAAKYARK